MFFWNKYRLHSASATTRARAIIAISREDRRGRRDPRAVSLVLAALHDVEESVRVTATGCLGYFNDQRAFRGVLSALRDPATEVRHAAIIALPSLHRLAETSDFVRGHGIEALKAFLADPNEAIRKAARESLDSIAQQERTLKTLKQVLPAALEVATRNVDRERR